MAFSRSFLESIGLSKEQIASVMEEHIQVVNGLKEERDTYKADAEKLPEVQKKLDELSGVEGFKERYEQEHTAFEAYKAEIKEQAEKNQKEAAYRELLKEEKISDKRLDAVIRLTDFSKISLNKDGGLTNADKLREDIRSEWSDYIVTTRTERENVATPPTVQNGGKMTREDIFKRDDRGRYVLTTEERQKAIAENPQAFR